MNYDRIANRSKLWIQEKTLIPPPDLLGFHFQWVKLYILVYCCTFGTKFASLASVSWHRWEIFLHIRPIDSLLHFWAQETCNKIKYKLNYEKFILTSIWSKYSQICYSTMYCKFWSPFINIGHLPSVMAECVKNLFGDSWSCLWCKFSPTCNGSNV